MSRFNLSEWAVNNKPLVVFLMLLCVVGGIGAYERLGRQEDPDFSVQTMVVQVSWPGATAIDTLKQVTDRLEKKLEETPNLDCLKSYTKPGQANVFVYLKESTPKAEIQDIWYQVRKKGSWSLPTFAVCARSREKPGVLCPTARLWGTRGLISSPLLIPLRFDVVSLAPLSARPA